MKRILEFNSGYGRALDERDELILQLLCEQCDDVALQLTGTHVGPDAAKQLLAEAAFKSTPQVQGSCIGIFDFSHLLMGALVVRQNQPDVLDWYIGSLMFKPDFRSQGHGHKVIQAFQHYVHEQGGKRILLAVMWSNPRAMTFWKHLGFEAARPLGPIQFGQLTQSGMELQQIVKNYQGLSTQMKPILQYRISSG